MPAFAPSYANALADVAAEEKLGLAEVLQQLQDFSAAFAGNRDLREALLNPVLSQKKRVAILDAVNRKIGLSPKVRNFLAVLMSHGRLSALREIIEQYRLEMNRRMGVSQAEVITARRLEDEERAEVEHRVGELAGTAVHAVFREDASLIGGAIVRIGSTVYDGSIKGRLERLKERLVSS